MGDGKVNTESVRQSTLELASRLDDERHMPDTTPDKKKELNTVITALFVWLFNQKNQSR